MFRSVRHRPAPLAFSNSLRAGIFSETGRPVYGLLEGLLTQRRTLVLGLPTLPLSLKGGMERKESGRMARLPFSRSRSCDGPRRAGVRWPLHQLGDDHVQPDLRLVGPRLGSSGLVDGRTRSELLAVGASTGDGAGRSRGADSRSRRLGGYRGHSSAPTEELAVAGTRSPLELRGARGAGAGSHVTVRGRGGCRTEDRKS